MGELANKAMGKTKRAVGRTTGDRHLEAEGRRQETAGKVQGGVRRAGRAVNRGVEKLTRKAGQANRRRAVRPTTQRRRA